MQPAVSLVPKLCSLHFTISAAHNFTITGEIHCLTQLGCILLTLLFPVLLPKRKRYSVSSEEFRGVATVASRRNAVTMQELRTIVIANQSQAELHSQIRTIVLHGQVSVAQPGVADQRQLPLGASRGSRPNVQLETFFFLRGDFNFCCQNHSLLLYCFTIFFIFFYRFRTVNRLLLLNGQFLHFVATSRQFLSWLTTCNTKL